MCVCVCVCVCEREREREREKERERERERERREVIVKLVQFIIITLKSCSFVLYNKKKPAKAIFC